MEQRSERAGLLAALAAPLLLWAVRASWLWVLVGGAAAGGFYLLLCRLQPLQDLSHVTRTVIGPGAARVLLWAQAVGLALAGGWLLRQADAIVPNLTRGFPWIAIPLLCLAMAAVWRGPKAARATCAVLVWLPAVTAAVIVLAALPQLHGAWLRPTGRPMQLVGAFAVFLFPVVSRYTSSEKAGSREVDPGGRRGSGAARPSDGRLPFAPAMLRRSRCRFLPWLHPAVCWARRRGSTRCCPQRWLLRCIARWQPLAASLTA